MPSLRDAMVVEMPPQANAVEGDKPAAVGTPEGQQTVRLALLNQMETLVGDLRVAYERLGMIPPESLRPDVFRQLQDRYVDLMGVAAQLWADLDKMGQALGEPMGISESIDRFQGEVEAFIQAVESELADAIGADADNGGPIQPAANGAIAQGGGGISWLKWGAVVGAVVLLGAGGYYVYQRQRNAVTPAY